MIHDRDIYTFQATPCKIDDEVTADNGCPVGHCVQGPVNCYPGVSGTSCYYCQHFLYMRAGIDSIYDDIN